MHPDGAGGMGPLQGRTTLKIEVALTAEFGKAPSAHAHLWMHILSATQHSGRVFLQQLLKSRL